MIKNVGFKSLSFNKETKEITLVERVFEQYEDGTHKIYEQEKVFKKGDDVSEVPYGSFKSAVNRFWNQ